MTLLIETTRKKKISVDSLIEKLYRTEEKSEIINGEITKMPSCGFIPNRAASKIFISLFNYENQTKFGYALNDNIGFIVDLPNRKSFSPDASFFIGETSGMKFLQGAPVFAVEVRSENDSGEKAEKAIKQKRKDYFAAGTKVVWDVDLLGENVIKSYDSENSDTPKIFKRGEIANAEFALPNWTFAVDELFD